MMKSATMFYTEPGKDIAKLQTEAYTHMMTPTALVPHSCCQWQSTGRSSYQLVGRCTSDCTELAFIIIELLNIRLHAPSGPSAEMLESPEPVRRMQDCVCTVCRDVCVCVCV